jgi:phosphonatase-like hydrolase
MAAQTVNDLDLIVFDIAGTIIKDRGEVPDAFSAVLAEHGVQITSEDLLRVRGSSKRDAFLSLIPVGPDQAGRAEAAYASFRRNLIGRYETDGVWEITSAKETLKYFRDQRIHVAINTGFDRDITTLVLSALEWPADLVEFVVCGDDVPQGRPAPFMIYRAMEATRTMNVGRVACAGDTTLDLLAGYNARVQWNVGVLSGAHSLSQLEQVPHTHILQSIAELPDLWP